MTNLSLPTEPYLIELLQRTAQDEIELIIAGGLGIYLKRRWVAEEVQAQRRKTLLEFLPDARATSDIDAFLKVEVLLEQPKREQFCACLEELGYRPTKKFIHFARQTQDPRYNVKLDLLAFPEPHSNLKVSMGSRPKRMGPRDHKTNPPQLHAFPTLEAFAVHQKVQTLPLWGKTLEGTDFAGTVRVPHPFASLCMKIRAASDHEQALPGERKARGAKHAQDAYLLVAMLSDDEVDDCHSLRESFAEHPELATTCEECVHLFARRDSPGSLTIQQQSGDADLDTFTSVLTELFPA